MEIEGKIENGEIILSGEDRAAGSLVRGIWKPQNGDVRETAVTSTDGGNTWKPWFDLVFRRKASAVGDAHTSADDRKAPAALDFKYPAAVKENDAATMEAILADDFALVTERRICSRKRAAAACAMNAKTTPSRQCEFGAIPR